MLPTPSTSHVTFDNIYEPAEDSFLFLDTLSSASETSFLAQRFATGSPSPLVLEVGTGSGVVLAFVGANAPYIFGRSDLALLGTDINLLATRAAHGTASRALSDSDTDRHGRASMLDIVAADLAGPFRHHQIDVLMFNPPYVPTESVPGPLSSYAEVSDSASAFARDSQLLELSYAGGADGMLVTDRLLDELPALLSNLGVAYVLLCAQNKPEEVKRQILLWPGGWRAETVGSSGKKAGWERLCIIRIWR